MTWRGERRRQLPPDWPARRRARLELDGQQCTALDSRGYRCTARATDVDHHVTPHDHRIEALRSLCDFHHKQKTQAEAQAARGAGPKRLRPRPKHPGLT